MEKHLKICLSLLLILFTSLSWARKPAVEDFVGIDNPEPEVIPQGTEALFNFEKEINDHGKPVQKQAVIRTKTIVPVVTETPEASLPWAGLLGLLTLLGLPFASWFAAYKSKKSIPANVENMDDYRQKKDSIKKAS
jgi:hypothetical protein